MWDILWIANLTDLSVFLKAAYPPMSSVLLYFFLPYFLKTGFFTEPGARKPQILLSLCPVITKPWGFELRTSFLKASALISYAISLP